MSKTTLTGKSQQKAIRFEFDVLAWLTHFAGDCRGIATVAKEKLRSKMNDEIAAGLYIPPAPPKPRKVKKNASKVRT